jgi:DNA-binding beta-propeller fold protein YncE
MQVSVPEPPLLTKPERRNNLLVAMLMVLEALLFLPISSAAAPATKGVPEIKRVATFQSQGGQKLLHNPLALALDPKNGDLIVSSFGSGEIVILDGNGSLINRLGAGADLVSPYGVAVDEKGRIYVSEIQTGMVKVLSPGGIMADRIDLSLAVGRPVAPGRITLDQEGRLYVADLKAHEILLFTGQGDYLGSVGGFAYLQKAGLWKDLVIGLSAHGQAVHLYADGGGLVRIFGEHGGDSASSFSFPTGFAVDAKGRLWIADAFQHRLKVFSLEGQHLFNFGRLEQEAGGFFFPVDICFGSNGRLYVLEKGADRIQIFQVSDLQ